MDLVKLGKKALDTSPQIDFKIKICRNYYNHVVGIIIEEEFESHATNTLRSDFTIFREKESRNFRENKPS